MQSIRKSDVVDIFGIVYEMRKERVWMVQTEQQYICIHQVWSFCVIQVWFGFHFILQGYSPGFTGVGTASGKLVLAYI